MVSVTNVVATMVQNATNGLATAGITNGLATTNYVNGITNGLATVSYVNFGTNFVVTNDLAQLNAASNILAGKIVAATNGFGDIVTHSAGELRPTTVWSGTSADATLGKNKSWFAAPNNSLKIAAQSYASGGTSVPATRSITLTNLYVIISPAVASDTSTLTILTNGVATPISVNFTASQTTGNDTTDSVTVPAGTEIGIEITTGTGTVAMWSWSFEGW